MTIQSLSPKMGWAVFLLIFHFALCGRGHRRNPPRAVNDDVKLSDDLT